MQVTKKVVLHFPESLVEKPVTYELVKKYDIIFNILKAKIAIDGGEGLLLLELAGSEENLNKGLKYLRELGIKIESLSKDIIWFKDNCIMCGICSSICPSHAFHIRQPEMEVVFEPEKCIGCEECLKVCPYNAIRLKLI
ncbi:MAG: NIL domain-containing protein [candidate division WOR-3 bacterium]